VKLSFFDLFRRRNWSGLYADWLRSKGVVIGGPFKGMRYVSDSVGSQYWPKLFGTYEAELAELLPIFDRERFGGVVDVGAAEGYYAVGCAVRWPDARVIAFEAEEHGRGLLGKMAELNGVSDRVEVRGLAEPADLRQAFAQLPDKHTLCIMDVEGAEAFLCDPEVVPELTRVHILVETHEFAVPGLDDLLKARFASSHTAVAIEPRPRTIADFAGIVPDWVRMILGQNLSNVVDEWRTPNCAWLYLVPTK